MVGIGDLAFSKAEITLDAVLVMQLTVNIISGK